MSWRAVGSRFIPCAVVPTYNNPRTIAEVVHGLRRYLADVFMVDDGSDPAGRRACERLEAQGLARLIRHPSNLGKGAAVQTGFAAARQAGFSHALQVDADGQHDLSRVPAFLQAARAQPQAMILAYPTYAGRVPWVRRIARHLTTLWVAIELNSFRRVRDALIGFRVYPLAADRALPICGHRMEFDVEIAVRSAWAGSPIVNLPVPVRYLRPEEGGVSHFRAFRDSLRMAWLHSRLCTRKAFRFFLRPFGVRL